MVAAPPPSTYGYALYDVSSYGTRRPFVPNRNLDAITTGSA
jgi:hypothetical protein